MLRTLSLGLAAAVAGGLAFAAPASAAPVSAAPVAQAAAAGIELAQFFYGPPPPPPYYGPRYW